MTNWERLQSLMSELLRTYQEILTLSTQKKEILVAGKPVDLAEIVKQEEGLIVRASKLEAARQQVITTIVKDGTLDTESLTLAALIVFAPEHVAERIRSISQEFDCVLKELKNQNNLNTRLLKQALNLVNFNINLLMQNSVGSTYSQSGSRGQSLQGRTIIDQKG